VSDDKTRILTPEDLERLASVADRSPGHTTILTPEQMARIDAAARAGGRPAAPGGTASGRGGHEPRFVGERIIFFCPNGHRLVVAAAHAGKRGRCDKPGCGVPVVIPAPPVVPAVEPEAEAPSAETAPEEAAATGDAAAVPGELVFEPAQAPVADSADESPATEEQPATEPTADWASSGEPQSAPADSPVLTEATGAEAAAALAWGEADDEGDTYDNPTARLVARLWMEREHGGVMELHLAGGSVIVPDAYEQRWSRGTHGLFASQAADGTVTLTAVAWDTVQKVIVRQVKGLPYGMFE
jgi:hypothetical protein